LAISSFTIKSDDIIGLDLLKLMEVRIDFKIDQLEIGCRKFPLRSAQAGVVRTDSPSLEAKGKEPVAVEGAFEEARRVEPEAGREPSRGANEGGRRTT
jgi:hypothetical protein